MTEHKLSDEWLEAVESSWSRDIYLRSEETKTMEILKESYYLPTLHGLGPITKNIYLVVSYLSCVIGRLYHPLWESADVGRWLGAMGPFWSCVIQLFLETVPCCRFFDSGPRRLMS